MNQTDKRTPEPRKRHSATPTDRTGDNVATRLNRLFATRWIDKVIALVALLPFAYAIGEVARAGELDLPRLGLILQLAVMVLTIALRRPPVRVTANPFFWVLACVATYWQFLWGPFYEAGKPLAPAWVASSVSLLALVVSLWARLSLGRNIGFVPAERAIVTRGAYAYVRHPIYTGIFIGVVATDLYDFSWRNFTIDALWCLVWVIKTFIEEAFLRQNPDYARYMERVRWRWFPGIA